MKFPVSFAAVLLAIVWAAPANAEELPIADFVRHGDYLELTISPDGEHLAARLRQDGTVFLAFFRTSDKQVVGGVRPGADSEVHSVTWVNNERVVFEYAERQLGRDAPVPTGELFAINIDGSDRKMLYGYRAGDSTTGSRISRQEDTFASQDVLSVLPDDERNILIIEYPWSQEGGYWYDNRSKQSIISRLNIYSGKKKKVETLPYNGAQAIATQSGEVNFISWEDEDNFFHAAYREGGKGDWLPLEVPFIDASPQPVAVNAAATKAYFLIPYGERRIDTLYELELATGEYTQMFDGLKASLNDWVVDAETLEPVVGVSEFDKSHYHYAPGTTSKTARFHKALTNAFAGKDISITSASQDGKLLVVRVQADTDPGEFQILNTETKSADYLWPNRSWIDPTAMRPMQHLEFQAEDGVTFYGYLTLPQLADGDPPPPMIVVLHGGPHGARNYWQFDSEVQLFANRGYAVLQVNYRGSGGYGGVFRSMGYREWGGKMIDDITFATRQVADSGVVDADRMCVYGGSYGGYAALMSVARDPQLFQCAIGFAGVYDLRLMYSEGDIPDSWGGSAYLERVLGTDEDLLTEFSPVSHVDDIEAAIMLIHGNQDRRVPIEHAKVMRKRLEKAGKSVTWQNYGRAGHGIYDEEDRLEMYEGMLEFIGKEIGP